MTPELQTRIAAVLALCDEVILHGATGAPWTKFEGSDAMLLRNAVPMAKALKDSITCLLSFDDCGSVTWTRAQIALQAITDQFDL